MDLKAVGFDSVAFALVSQQNWIQSRRGTWIKDKRISKIEGVKEGLQRMERHNN
jgi:hypothetical protein